MNNQWLKTFLGIILSIIMFHSFGYTAPLDSAVEKENYDSVKKDIARYAKMKMKESQLTGLSLALVDDQKIIWTLSLGYADRENKAPVTSDTLFRIGSISKLFTATAIMQLVEQGKIDLDKPLQTYIPEFSMKTRFPDAGPITIRSIMTHSSGLPCDYLPVYSPSYPYFTQLVKDIKNEYVAYPPGYITAYSNLAFALLGVVIERVSGKKFNDYMTEYIFKPLGMNCSSFELRNDMEHLVSKGYRNNKPAADDLYLGIWPPGSIYSNVNEMSQFIRMILESGNYKGRQILEKATLNEMFTPQTNLPLDLDAKGEIGLTWILGQDPYWGKVVGHNGGTALFFSWVMVLRERKLGVIVLTNSAKGAIPAKDICRELINKALGVKIGPLQEHDKTTPVVPVSEIRPKPIEGDYATRLGLINIKKQGGNLYAEIQSYPQIKFLVLPQAGKRFALRPLLFGLFPYKIKEIQDLRLYVADVGGIKVMLANHNGVRSIFGEAIELKPLPAKWLKRCGEYHASVNTYYTLISGIKLQVYKGALAVLFNNNKMEGITQPVMAIPLSDNELLIPGLGRSWNTTIRVIKVGGIERFTYKGLEFVKGYP